MSDQPPVNILLVDDRPENLLALEAILDTLGENLVRANSGNEALKQLLRQEFAVILLDVQMPGLNGFETAQLIKARERTRSVPIIFLTAISKEETYVFKGYEVGAVDYMSKPFQPDVLRSKVAVFVELYRKQEQIKAQEQLLRESERRELELRHLAELVESEAKTAEIVDSAMDAIITFDESRKVTLFNAAAERMFCVAASEAIGSPMNEFFPAPFRDDYLDAICSAVAPKRGNDCDNNPEDARALESLTGLRRTGEHFPLEASISCLELKGTKVYTVIGRDVTERKRTEEELRTQAISLANTTAELTATNETLSQRQLELERAMNARNRFYASMSHELRTPINAIIGYNTLLLDNIYGPLNGKQKEGLQRTLKAARHLLELVNDVLDLSKIEAGKIELTLQPVMFPYLIEDLFVTVRPLADEYGSSLSLEMDGEPFNIVSDPRRVRQILLNLLSNAIKFGEGKPIRVACKQDPNRGVEIEVIDEGVGIAKDDISRIFEEFVQVSESKQPGTGLGLPISRRLAQLLDGSLTVRSTPGQGSSFCLTLPASLEDDMAPVAALSAATAA